MRPHPQPAINHDLEADSTRPMLDAIETRDHVTQRDLAGELGIALGLTSIYLKRCIKKGLVVRKAPARRYAYYLTAKGFGEKARLTAKYLTRSPSFFGMAREDCSDLFGACREQGLDRVALVGAGDLCGIAILAALDGGIQPVAVFDEATNRQRVAGVPIGHDLAALAGIDAVIVTDMKDPQGRCEQMAAALGDDQVLSPSLLRLSRRRPLPAAAAQ